MPIIPKVEQKHQVMALPAKGIAPTLNAPQLRLPRTDSRGIDAVARGQQAIARSLDNVSNMLGDAAINEKKKADRAKVLEAEQFLTKWEMENVDAGSLQRRGGDAIGEASRLSQNFDIAMNEYRNNMNNDDQIAAYDQLVMSRGLTNMRRVLNHESQETRGYYKEQATTTIKLESDRAVRNAKDVNMYNNSIRNAQAAFESWATGEGLPQNAIDMKKKDIADEVHFQTASLMASTDPDGFLDSVDGTRDVGGVSVSANTSRGIRNNNPGNLRKTNDNWKGSNGADSEGFVTFDSPQAGLRAMSLNLVNQQRKHGLNTIESIIEKYAPPNENDTQNYVNFMSKQLGVDPRQEIDLENEDTLQKFTAAVILMENGLNPYSEDLIDTGVRQVLGREKYQVAGEIQGLKAQGNLDLNNRPQVMTEEGEVATVRSMSINYRGKEVLIPTVSENGQIMSDEDAIKAFKETGKHLGKFDTPENATAYAKSLHVSQESGLEQSQQALSNVQAFDSLPWDKQQKIITTANTLSERNHRLEERRRKEIQSRNMFDTYEKVTNPKTREDMDRNDIIQLVNSDQLSGEQGRQLIKLLETDESREDDLATFAELSRSEAQGELTVEDVMKSHASGRLTSATAKRFVEGLTSNLSGNEAYQAGSATIKAQFDRSEFGVAMGDTAEREAKALREYQRRVSDGESPFEVADDVVGRLKDSAASDRVYQRTLSEIRKEVGVSTTNLEGVDQAAKAIADAAARGQIQKGDAARKLNALKRRREELQSGGR